MHCLVNPEHVDIAGLRETFLNMKNKDLISEFNLPDYKLFVRDRDGQGVTAL